MMKFEVLEALEQLEDNRAKLLVELGREFYKLAGQKDRINGDLELCKEAIRLAFRIMDIIGNNLFGVRKLACAMLGYD